jgi:hypothetical protein
LVLLQVLDYFSGTFDWPRQIQQLTTVALLIGLPVALILACYHGAAAEAYARRILKAANSAGDTLAHAVLLVAATLQVRDPFSSPRVRDWPEPLYRSSAPAIELQSTWRG